MAASESILIVDDDRSSLAMVERLLRRMGLQALTAEDAFAALTLLKEQTPDLVLADLEMPRMSGIELLREIRTFNSELMVVIMTGYATVETAVDAMKDGAFDYIRKPVNYDYLRIVVDKALERKRLIAENRQLRARLDDQCRFHNIIGRSAGMRRIFATVEKVAPTNANILIHGESGTGKELIARAVHAYSQRREQPFVAVDCVALPSHLVESELFGHEKGAFTGAATRRPGLLETAQSGTFFLDEITEMDVGLQAKLLRMLQERQFRRVGGRDLIDVNIRVIAATKRDPDEAVAKSRLREDLYYRLNVIPIQLPPLRERPEDVPLLVHHFLQQDADSAGPSRGITPEVLDRLQAYPWPGNVRELKNIIERLNILAQGDRIGVEDLPGHLLADADTASGTTWMSAFPFKTAKQRWLQGFEREYLLQMLAKYDGNVSRAAAASEINRKTFHRLMNKHDVDREAARDNAAVDTESS